MAPLLCMEASGYMWSLLPELLFEDPCDVSPHVWNYRGNCAIPTEASLVGGLCETASFPTPGSSAFLALLVSAALGD